MSVEEERRYTAKEFAARIGRSLSTLRYWEKRGYLTPHRYPSRVRYYLERDVELALGINK